jgi:hypothetical protein
MNDKDWGSIFFEAMVLERQGLLLQSDALMDRAVAMVLGRNFDLPKSPIVAAHLPRYDMRELALA